MKGDKSDGARGGVGDGMPGDAPDIVPGDGSRSPWMSRVRGVRRRFAHSIGLRMVGVFMLLAIATTRAPRSRAILARASV